MRYAINQTGERVEALKGSHGICEQCGSEVIAKCGDIKVWHWAHRNLTDCDTWVESEMTEWHRAWQDEFPKQNQEIVLGPNREHRADVMVGDVILEIQHSPLSVSEIQERERFYGQYGRLFWLFDVRGSVEAQRIEEVSTRRWLQYKSLHTYRWKWPKRSITAAKRPVFLDMGVECYDLLTPRNLWYDYYGRTNFTTIQIEYDDIYRAITQSDEAQAIEQLYEYWRNWKRVG